MENVQNEPTFTWKAKAPWGSSFLKCPTVVLHPLLLGGPTRVGFNTAEWEVVKEIPKLAEIITSQVGSYGQIFT